MKKIHDSIKNNFSSLSIFRYTHDRSFFKSFFRLTKIPKQPLSFRPIPEPNTPYIPQKFNKNDDLPIPPSSLSREKQGVTKVTAARFCRDNNARKRNMKGGEICVMRRGERWVDPYSKGIFESVGGKGERQPGSNAPNAPQNGIISRSGTEEPDSVHGCNNTPKGSPMGLRKIRPVERCVRACVRVGVCAGSRAFCGSRSRKTTRRGSGCNVRFPRAPEATGSRIISVSTPARSVNT